MTNLKYITTDINSQGNNIAWFEINGESWGRCEDGAVVDCDGHAVYFNEEYSFVPEYREAM